MSTSVLSIEAHVVLNQINTGLNREGVELQFHQSSRFKLAPNPWGSITLIPKRRPIFKVFKARILLVKIGVKRTAKTLIAGILLREQWSLRIVKRRLTVVRLPFRFKAVLIWTDIRYSTELVVPNHFK
jgi:hypothetical protein